MNTSISVICYKYKTLKNGKCTLMLRIIKDRKTLFRKMFSQISKQKTPFFQTIIKNELKHKEMYYLCIKMQFYGIADRIADQLLRDKLGAMGAVLIEGPKVCGKTTTAEQQAKSIIFL